MQVLRQSTASQEISLGFFLDSTDGNTEETGLTIANTDIKLRKGGTTTLASKNSGGATSISNGIYHATLDATDTNTVGMLEIYVHVAGALVIKDRYQIVTQTVYDLLYASGATGDVKLQAITHTGATIPTITTITDQVSADITAISGDATAANNLEADYDGTGYNKSNSTIGTVTANTDTAIKLTSMAGATFSTSTDSLEAIRDRGDSDWVTGGGGSAPTKEEIRIEMDDNSTKFAAIIVDTGTDIPNTLTTIEGKIDTVDGVVDAIKVDTTAILEDTGTTLPNQITGIPNSVLAAGDIDGFTLEESQKLVLASQVGKLSGAATTTVVIKAADDSKTRITGTVDGDGNRTSVTTDVTG